MICLQKKEYNFDILKQGSERFRFWSREFTVGAAWQNLAGIYFIHWQQI